MNRRRVLQRRGRDRRGLPCVAAVPLFVERLSSRARHQHSRATPCWRPPGRCSPGPTRYISLATVAFFGIGAYTVGVLGEAAAVAAGAGGRGRVGAAVALVVGLSTLRLSGMYFVIFTFGLAELVRQLVTWYEVNIHRSVGRYIFVDITPDRDLLAAAGARRAGVRRPAG